MEKCSKLSFVFWERAHGRSQRMAVRKKNAFSFVEWSLNEVSASGWTVGK
jgi:hypothetical protein